MNYSVIGDTVNLTARLQGLAVKDDVITTLETAERIGSMESLYRIDLDLLRSLEAAGADGVVVPGRPIVAAHQAGEPIRYTADGRSTCTFCFAGGERTVRSLVSRDEAAEMALDLAYRLPKIAYRL